MRLLTREFAIKGLFELLVVIMGVSVAFWVEQYRENLNKRKELIDVLRDVDESLREDSIQITSSNYDEIKLVIASFDTAIITLTNGETPDLTNGPSIITQPLMDFSNPTLIALAKTDLFNDINSIKLKSTILFYNLSTADLWEKEKRILDYLQNSTIPTLHTLDNLYTGRHRIIGREFRERELSKALNDLRLIKMEYQERLDRLWPYIVEQNSKVRLEIKRELIKMEE